ncbi:MAG: hypothetical protein M3Z27_00520 [Actinomycetota bacterium]|nr:hypothetical protein [Actinomycetota bacterium]
MDRYESSPAQGASSPESAEADPYVTDPAILNDSSSKGRSGARGNMLPGRQGRRFGLERLLVRLIATCGIVGIGVVLGAILAASKVQGWITGLVVALVSVILAALLWSSRQL